MDGTYSFYFFPAFFRLFKFVDENEEEGEDRSEIDVDEETRQFIEIYDHVYGRHLSPDLMTTTYPSIGNTDQVDNETSNGIDRIGVGGVREDNRSDGAGGSNSNGSGAPGSPGRLMTFQMNISGIPESINSNHPVQSSGSNQIASSGGELAPQVNDEGGGGGNSTESSSSAVVDQLGGEQSSSNSTAQIRINISAGVGNSGNISTSPSSVVTSNSHQHHHHYIHSTTRSISNISSGPSLGVAYNSSSDNSNVGAGNSSARITVSVSAAPSQQQLQVVSAVTTGVANSLSQAISAGSSSSGGVSGTSQIVASGSGGNSSSISQRLVAFTRTLRSQLGTAENNPSNVRQRRYQLLSLNSRNTPIILQRLLGPGGAFHGTNTAIQDTNTGEIHITNPNSSSSNAFRDATRVVLMDNAFGIFSNTDEGSIDLVDQAGYLFGRSLAATLSSTPTALHWWLEEAKALGLESQSDICLTVANNLIPQLQMQKSLELAKIRGKKKKKQADDDKATAEADAGSSKVAGDEQKMEKDDDDDDDDNLLVPMANQNLYREREQRCLENLRNYAVRMNTVETMTTESQQINSQEEAATTVSTDNTNNDQSLQSSQRTLSEMGHDSSSSQQHNGPNRSSSFFMRNYSNALPDLTDLANAAFLINSAEFTDSEDLDNTLLNQDQNNTANSRINDLMSGTSPSDFVSDTEHSLPDTTLLQDNEDEDDDDENDDEDDDDEDEEVDVVNNSSDEQEESIEVGEEVLNTYDRFTTTSGRQMADTRSTPPPPVLQHGDDPQPEQTQEPSESPPVLSPHVDGQTEQSSAAVSGRNGGSEALISTMATNESAAGSNIGNENTQGDIDGEDTLPYNIVMGSSSISLLSPNPAHQQQPITDEEMAAAVLIPLPIDDDDDEELDDILEILDVNSILQVNCFQMPK